MCLKTLQENLKTLFTGLFTSEQPIFPRINSVADYVYALDLIQNGEYYEVNYKLSADNPVKIKVAGVPTEGDLKYLQRIIVVFNRIPNFPQFILDPQGDFEIFYSNSKEIYEQYLRERNIKMEYMSHCRMRLTIEGTCYPINGYIT